MEPHQGVSDGYEEAGGGEVAHYDQGEFQYENYGESEDGALVDASVYDTSIDKGKQINQIVLTTTKSIFPLFLSRSVLY